MGNCQCCSDMVVQDEERQTFSANKHEKSPVVSKLPVYPPPLNLNKRFSSSVGEEGKHERLSHLEVKKHMWINEMELKEIRAVQDLELETWQTNTDTQVLFEAVDELQTGSDEMEVEEGCVLGAGRIEQEETKQA